MKGAVIENGMGVTASKGGGLLHPLAEEDRPTILVETLVMRLQAWTWTVLEEVHEMVPCLLHLLLPNHLNHLFMAMVGLEETA